MEKEKEAVVSTYDVSSQKNEKKEWSFIMEF